MLSQMLFSCTYGEKCVTRSWNFLYITFQATCNVLAQWVKRRWLVVAHFLPQGNFQMLTGMRNLAMYDDDHWFGTHVICPCRWWWRNCAGCLTSTWWRSLNSRRLTAVRSWFRLLLSMESSRCVNCSTLSPLPRMGYGLFSGWPSDDVLEFHLSIY